MAAKDELGRWGEALAAEHLTVLGLSIIDSNWRCSHGELDLVALDGHELVFVEVKTRSSNRFGHPLEAVTVAKVARLRRLASAWCEAHPGSHRGSIRIDVIAILAPGRGAPQIEHLERVS